MNNYVSWSIRKGFYLTQKRGQGYELTRWREKKAETILKKEKERRLSTTIFRILLSSLPDYAIFR